MAEKKLEEHRVSFDKRPTDERAYQATHVFHALEQHEKWWKTQNPINVSKMRATVKSPDGERVFVLGRRGDGTPLSEFVAGPSISIPVEDIEAMEAVDTEKN